MQKRVRNSFHTHIPSCCSNSNSVRVMEELNNVFRSSAVNADLFFRRSSLTHEPFCEVLCAGRAAVNVERILHTSSRQTAGLPFSPKTERCCVDLSGRLSADSSSSKIYTECVMRLCLVFIIFIWELLFVAFYS